MPFCPACRQEYRPAFSRCEECEADLVESLPPEPPVTAASWPRVVYATTFLSDAEAVRLFLESEGIEAAIEGDHAAFLTIGMPGAAADIRVVVPEDREREARERLATRPRPAEPGGARRLPLGLALGVAVSGIFGLQVLWHNQEPPTAMLAGLLWLMVMAIVLTHLREANPARKVPLSRIALFALWGGLAAPLLAVMTEALAVSH